MIFKKLTTHFKNNNLFTFIMILISKLAYILFMPILQIIIIKLTKTRKQGYYFKVILITLIMVRYYQSI